MRFATFGKGWGAILGGALLLLGTACASAPKPAGEAPSAEAREGEGQRIELFVTEDGFVPSSATVQAGEPVTLVITRRTDRTCAKEILIPALDIEEELPLGEPVTITFTPEKPGELRFGCGMGQMIGGVLLVQ